MLSNKIALCAISLVVLGSGANAQIPSVPTNGSAPPAAATTLPVAPTGSTAAAPQKALSGPQLKSGTLGQVEALQIELAEEEVRQKLHRLRNPGVSETSVQGGGSIGSPALPAVVAAAIGSSPKAQVPGRSTAVAPKPFVAVQSTPELELDGVQTLLLAVIDQEAVADVNLGGELRSLRIGDAVRNWKVFSISRTKGVVLVKPETLKGVGKPTFYTLPSFKELPRPAAPVVLTQSPPPVAAPGKMADSTSIIATPVPPRQ